MRRATAGTIAIAMAACSLMLVAGFWLKYRCTQHAWDGYQYRTSCYNDIYALYFFRGLNQKVFPYVHGDGVLENEVDANGNKTEIGDLEYPVVTGLFIGTAAEVARDARSFFVLNAAFLAACALAGVLLVSLMTRNRMRALYFAIAPALGLYAFHNWDLLAVALMCGGIFAFRARRDVASGTLLGLGAAAKVFPALILPALALTRWRAPDSRGVFRLLASSAVAFVAVNVPVAIANVRGWWLPWKFQSTRFPNFETWGYMIYRHLARSFGAFWSDTWPQATSLIAFALWLAFAAMLVRASARRAEDRPYALAFQLLLAFLLTGKIYSPQYALWVIPFFVLVRMPWYSFAAFAITDAAVWIAISAYFLAAPPLSAGDVGVRTLVLEVCVWVRYAVLAWLIWLAGRAPEDATAAEARAPRSAAPANALA
jgi:uncharacterized membrane protein